jgi:hypothetical protein
VAAAMLMLETAAFPMGPVAKAFKEKKKKLPKISCSLL